MGETSAAVVQALSVGKPLIVSDVGWFSELPDDVVVKIPVDHLEVDMLAAALERLADDRPLREELGRSARAHVEKEHSLERAADLYAAALEDVRGRPAVVGAVLDDVAQAAAEVGLGPSSPELAGIGARIRETGLGG